MVDRVGDFQHGMDYVHAKLFSQIELKFLSHNPSSLVLLSQMFGTKFQNCERKAVLNPQPLPYKYEVLGIENQFSYCRGSDLKWKIVSSSIDLPAQTQRNAKIHFLVK